MTWRRVLVVAAVLAGCALATAGCRESDSGTGLSQDWVTFSGESLSLELPDSFIGGDPRDPEVMAVLEDAAARNPNPAFREDLELFLDLVGEEGETIGHQLILWGEPDADGYMREVEAGRMEAMPVGMSLERWIPVLMGGYSESEWTFEEVGDTQAHVVLVHPLDDGHVLTKHEVYRVAGGSLYKVAYMYWDESDTETEAAFRASAKTITVQSTPPILYTP